MANTYWMPILLLWPLVAAAATFALRSVRRVLWFMAASVWALVPGAAALVMQVQGSGSVSAADGWLYADALTAFHVIVMLIVFVLSSTYAVGYFANDKSAALTVRKARRFAALWLTTSSAMMLVLFSNNLGIQWAGIEATTLVTAFLVCTHITPASLEAMWKYLIICSVGVALAFVGTLFFAAAMERAAVDGASTLLWTDVLSHAGELDPILLKTGFIFVVVGFGTKVGLAPLHSWLPDAHSQAPAPVSAIFSGFLLNTAMYCVMRYLAIVSANAALTLWAHELLITFGVLSMVVAAAFIVFQHDLKRLLAYSSIEHIGIIALGLGVGGLGQFAALFHVLNHSIAKMTAFFAAGRLGQQFGTNDMRRFARVLTTAPVWGGGLMASLLALIGVAPFALFMSELQLVRAAIAQGRVAAVVLFFAASTVVFIGALRLAIDAAWGGETAAPAGPPATALDKVLVAVPICVLLCLGLYLPEPVQALIAQASSIVGGAR